MGTRVTGLIACWTSTLIGVTGAQAAQPIVPPAYQLAADAAGIPATLLWAVALQESGLKWGSRLAPWPWTLNVAGVSVRFATREYACQGLRRALRRVPPTRVDVGLAQVNMGYHGKRASTPCELLDPYGNLAVAAALLLELHQPDESWIVTAGRYHHPAGGAEAARYSNALRQRLTGLQRAARSPRWAPPLDTVASARP
jgi:hypothetical protein